MTTKITTDVITDSAITSAKINDLAVTAGKLAATLDLSSKTVTLPALAVTAAMLASALDLSGKTLTLPAANTPVFTKSYTSTDQTITTAGALTLAHSLGAMPKLVQLRLKCTSAEHNYSIGDEVLALSGDANAGRYCSIVPDATNLNIRYGSSANAFNIPNKTTGASAAITNASWVAIFRAWA